MENNFDFLHAPYKEPKYLTSIPEYTPSFNEISIQMRINVDILKKEFSDHVDAEIKRFNESINDK